MKDFAVAADMTKDNRFIRVLRKIERIFNSITCVVMNGGHELYVVRLEEPGWFQRCLLCGHETKGWRNGKNGGTS